MGLYSDGVYDPSFAHRQDRRRGPRILAGWAPRRIGWARPPPPMRRRSPATETTTTWRRSRRGLVGWVGRLGTKQVAHDASAWRWKWLKASGRAGESAAGSFSDSSMPSPPAWSLAPGRLGWNGHPSWRNKPTSQPTKRIHFAVAHSLVLLMMQGSNSRSPCMIPTGQEGYKREGRRLFPFFLLPTQLLPYCFFRVVLPMFGLPF